jgi:glyoxylase-like metal-dependent hydrolase (beta-lactamase superfamily II)
MKIYVFELTPFVENGYVLQDGGETMVIDPGEASPALLSALEGQTVKFLVNTHCHLDHAGGNADIIQATGAPLVCHKLDLPLLQAMPEQSAMFGLEAPPSPDPDQYVEEGDTLKVGEVEMKILHVPGHTPGHIALLGDGFVIVGDVLFSGSIGRTDLWGGDHDQLLESIRTKLLTLPDDTRVYSGHGPATTIGEERKSNPYLRNL